MHLAALSFFPSAFMPLRFFLFSDLPTNAAIIENIENRPLDYRLTLFYIVYLQSVVSITRSMKLSPIVVKNASLFPSQVDARVVKGNTLLIDFIFYTHPVSFINYL